MIYHDSRKGKLLFVKNAYKVADSMAILARTIGERGDEIFAPNAKALCKEVQESYGMKRSRNKPADT